MIGLLMLLGVALMALLALLALVLALEMVRPPRHTAAYAIARGLPCDPSDLGFEFDQWILDRPDGAKLPVWEIQNPKSKIQNMTVVFLHGWGHSRIDILPRLPLFAELCDRLVLYDLRGHGESENSTSRLGDGEDDDLLALLDRLGDGPFLLVGHSMGAVIAVSALLKGPEAGLRHSHVLENVRTSRAVPVERESPPASVERRIAGVIAYGPYCEFHRSLAGRLKAADFPGRPITDLALLLLHLRGVRPLNLRPRDLENLKCPLLVIHGNQDIVAPIEHGRRIATAVASGSIVDVEGAGHIDAHTMISAKHDAAVRAFVANLKRTSMQAQSSGMAMPGL